MGFRDFYTEHAELSAEDLEFIQFINENTLYKDDVEKADFLSDDTNIIDAFIYNFVGILGAVNASTTQKNQYAAKWLQKYFRQDLKLRVNTITDENQNISLIIKHMHDKGAFLQPVTSQHITRFLVLAKKGAVQNVDQEIVREWVKNIKPSFINKASPTLRKILINFRDDVYGIVDVVEPLKKNRNKFTRHAQDFWGVGKYISVKQVKAAKATGSIQTTGKTVPVDSTVANNNPAVVASNAATKTVIDKDVQQKADTGGTNNTVAQRARPVAPTPAPAPVIDTAWKTHNHMSGFLKHITTFADSVLSEMATNPEKTPISKYDRIADAIEVLDSDFEFVGRFNHRKSDGGYLEPFGITNIEDVTGITLDYSDDGQKAVLKKYITNLMHAAKFLNFLYWDATFPTNNQLNKAISYNAHALESAGFGSFVDKYTSAFKAEGLKLHSTSSKWMDEQLDRPYIFNRLENAGDEQKVYLYTNKQLVEMVMSYGIKNIADEKRLFLFFNKSINAIGMQYANSSNYKRSSFVELSVLLSEFIVPYVAKSLSNPYSEDTVPGILFSRNNKRDFYVPFMFAIRHNVILAKQILEWGVEKTMPVVLSQFFRINDSLGKQDMFNSMKGISDLIDDIGQSIGDVNNYSNKKVSDVVITQITTNHEAMVNSLDDKANEWYKNLEFFAERAVFKSGGRSYYSFAFNPTLYKDIRDTVRNCLLERSKVFLKTDVRDLYMSFDNQDKAIFIQNMEDALYSLTAPSNQSPETDAILLEAVNNLSSLVLPPFDQGYRSQNNNKSIEHLVKRVAERKLLTPSELNDKYLEADAYAKSQGNHMFGLFHKNVVKYSNADAEYKGALIIDAYDKSEFYDDVSAYDLNEYLQYINLSEEESARFARTEIRKGFKFFNKSNVKDIYRRKEKQRAENFMFDILHDVANVDKDAANAFYENLDTYFQNKVRNKFAGANIIQKEVTGGAIQPFGTITSDVLKKMFKFNELDLDEIAKDVKVRKKSKETFTDYVKRVEESVNTSTALKPLQVEVVDMPKDELAALNTLIASTRNGKHGDVYPMITKVFDVKFDNSEFIEFMEKVKQEYGKVEQIIPAFHGTGGIAATMILRYGFKRIEFDRSVGMAGRMLGDGIYFATNVDKALQYVGNVAHTRRFGTKGYLFNMETILGKKGIDYASAGLGANDGIRSPEWVVRDPHKQLHVLKAYEVQIGNKRDFIKHIQSLGGLVNEEKTAVKSFKDYISESFEESKNYRLYRFREGTIPTIIDGEYRHVEAGAFTPSTSGVYVDVDVNGAANVYINSSKMEIYDYAETKDMSSEERLQFLSDIGVM